MAITLSPSKTSLGILSKIEGSVPFVDANGDLVEDNPNLFWDDAANRLGIGTNTPSKDLDVSGTSLLSFLEVANHITLLSQTSQLRFTNTAIVITGNEDNAGQLRFYTGTTERLRITSAGTVEVAGQVKITGGTPGVDKVLTSDAVGLATWQVPSGGGATVFAQLSSSVDQEPTVTTPVVVTYNTQDGIAGLTHSTTVNPGEITVVTAGTYYIMPQPQVGKDSGGAAQTLNVFVQVDSGSGFVDLPNSNIKITVSDNTATDVIVLGVSIVLAVGDKIRCMQRITNITVGLGLKFTAAEVGPPTIPATPSIIFTMFRVGA